MSLSLLGAATRLDEALDIIAGALSATGIEEARREARLVLGLALDKSHAELVRDDDQPLGDAFADVAAIATRRAMREPLSRIRGRRGFFDFDLVLGPETLDPRGDTETLVEHVLDALRALDQTPRPRALDLGTGTGAILIALARAMPKLTGLGVDIAEGAVRVARANSEAYGLVGRLDFAVGDLFVPADGVFDVIVSNPPYIPSAMLATLDPEVRLHDPARALDGGPDGLDFYRRIVAGARARLGKGGLLAFEIGAGQLHDVSRIIMDAGFCIRDVRVDLGGHARSILAD